MNLGIKDKVALVVGGSRGIGRGISDALAAAGCKVVIVSITPASVERAVADLRKSGARVEGIAADCVTKEGVECAVRFATDAFGGSDIAVFNVDSGPKGAFMDLDDETFHAAWNNNVMAFIWMCRAVVPHMRARSWGRILTVGTNSVKQPHRALPRAAQNTARVGALALCKTMSAELGPFGITVNTLGTGAIDTEQLRAVFDNSAASGGKGFEAWRAERSAQIPMRRIGTPKDMGDAAAFLCSERAGFITGQVLLVDGGQIESLQ